MFYKKNRERMNGIVLFVFFAFFCILLSLRHMSVGTDTKTYFYFYETLSNTDFKGIFNYFQDEYGFYIFVWLVAKIFKSYQAVMAVIAFVFVFIPMLFLYKKETDNPALTLAIFIGLCPFAFYFSGLSQVTAMAFAVPVYYLFKRKRIILPLFLIILATTFHVSAISLVLLLPILRLSFKKSFLLPSLVFILFVFVFKNYIFSFLSDSIQKYNYYSSTENNGSYTMFIFYVLLYVASFVLVRGETKNIYFVRWLLFVIACIQCMAPVSHVIMRVNYYFLVFLPVALSCFFAEKLIIEEKTKKVIVGLVCVFFIVYFLAGGIDSANLKINPYTPFWK